MEKSRILASSPPPDGKSRLILLHKPYGVLCQFRDAQGRPCLADYLPVPDVYPAGRLDNDSEGLVLLTNDGLLQHWISAPEHDLAKTYWVQVEGVISSEALEALQQGITLRDGPCRPAEARSIPTPADLWPRDPPVRYRAAIPTSWVEVRIREGRNRQVRRMTAAVGFPTLRLIRVAIGPWQLGNLPVGQWQEIPTESVIKWRHDLETTHHRRRRDRTRSTLSHGRGGDQRATHPQSTRRSSGSRRDTDRGRRSRNPRRDRMDD